MVASVFLDDCSARSKRHIDRARLVTEGMSEDRLNQTDASFDWTIAQIFQHMILSHGPYLDLIAEGLGRLPNASSEDDVCATWFGGFLSKQAGPGTNVPAPRRVVPPSTRFSLDVIDRWIAQHQAIIDLIEQSRGKNLNDKFMRNPMIKLFRMNLTDCFKVIVQHTERHVGQIEQRSGL